MLLIEDILNQINVESCIGHNPGITAMWEDERQRTGDIGLSSQVAPPVSQGSDDEHDEDIDEDKESILMSQPFWKDDKEEHDSQSSEEEKEMDWKPPLCMPRVDSPSDDEDSRGHV
ncbi:DNA polymerase zeta catalytic subunit-like [Xenia sp. Carnegie-2017]|uniref:DNA polymerase zeta catalytic subunit-like n=1 Tax=Xenia sp. Carnegie-2017 TaxID=2897299 RepID=UPI001F047E41|nr:DNA polymerase zeta catalytic subunit-like [Xenia sp. Carnegie-2017]XP_046863788.1 DNA polymerase zeta catalytic subunit-like [Xenia sp. Carnegie-2017]XP_046863789.1 DNA polymerase zeta catalytic subunit-like [Xenia sp. Carnegie-2017]